MASSLAMACVDADRETDSTAPIPGLDAANEVPLVETAPDPDDISFDWTHAYRVGELPPINVGRPSERFLEDAARDPAEAEDMVCLGSGGGSGCGVPSDSQPELMGITFGGADVAAWAWIGVPDEAVAVRFIDQQGALSWQRVAEGLVIFPDTVEDDPDGNCACRFDAVDSDGDFVVSVDLHSGTYVGD